MNAKISVSVIGVEAVIYLLLYNLYDCTFNKYSIWLSNRKLKGRLLICKFSIILQFRDKSVIKEKLH